MPSTHSPEPRRPCTADALHSHRDCATPRSRRVFRRPLRCGSATPVHGSLLYGKHDRRRRRYVDRPQVAATRITLSRTGYQDGNRDLQIVILRPSGSTILRLWPPSQMCMPRCTTTAEPSATNAERGSPRSAPSYSRPYVPSTSHDNSTLAAGHTRHRG